MVFLALLEVVAGCGGEALPPWDVSPVARGYHVLLITIDTLRADHLHCYGYPRETSRHLDALAARSQRFDQAFVQWPKTGPSIASIMTSTYGSTSGVMRTTGKIPVPRSYDCLAELLARAGYQTRAVVTNGSLSRKLNYDQGFEVYEQVFERDRAHAERMTAAAIELLRTRDPSRPFFQWVHYVDPHMPYHPPREYRERFVGDSLYEADQRGPVPLDPRITGEGKAPEGGLGAILKGSHLDGLDEVRDYVARYDAEILYLDEHVGTLLAEVEREGLLSSTLVIVTSDHGESLGDHGYYFRHGQLPYDACLRVPWILYHPDLPPRVIRAPVALLDLAPTVVEALHVPPGWQFEGTSLLRHLHESSDPTRPVFSEAGYHDAFSLTVRHGDYKLIHVGDPRLAKILRGEPRELYHVASDPGETLHLGADGGRVARGLRRLLDPVVAAAYGKVPPIGDGEAILSDEAERNLVELGYVDGK